MPEVSVTRLAATHAALDSERRGWRGDVLISAAIEVLTTTDALSVKDLTRLVNRLWGIDAVTEELMSNALLLAEKAFLVRDDGDGRWSATDDAKHEARTDREWANATLGRAQKEFSDRLVECCESTIPEERFDGLFHQFLVALTAGAEGIYEAAADSAAPERLRPIRFELGRIGDSIRTSVQPKPVARAMVELAVSATDPDDDFATDIVRLIMVGNILHAFLGRRDVPERVSLSGIRAVLDTSVLVYLVHEDPAARQIFRALAEKCRAAGVELVVADHTLDEWERLWKAADEDLKDGEKALGGSAYVLIQNPFVRAFLREREEDPGIGWARFQVGRRDIRPLLESLGIRLRPHGNFKEEDKQFVNDVRSKLMDFSRDQQVRGHRSHNTADADAQSCAMVARWRKGGQSGLPRGWFFAADFLTGRAYSELRPGDSYPLTVSAESWLLFLAHVTTETAEDLGRLATAISDLAARQAFLSVATGYTVEEAIKLSEMLAEHDVLSPIDLQAVVTSDFVGLVEEAEDARAGGDHLTRKASNLIRLRSARRDARAKREEKRTQDERQAYGAEVAGLRAQVEVLQQAISTTASEGAATEAKLRRANKRLRRGMGIGIFSLILVGAVVALGLLGLLGGIYLGLAILGTVICLSLGIRYTRDPEVTIGNVVVSFVLSLAWVGVGVLLDQLAGTPET